MTDDPVLKAHGKSHDDLDKLVWSRVWRLYPKASKDVKKELHSAGYIGGFERARSPAPGAFSTHVQPAIDGAIKNAYSANRYDMVGERDDKGHRAKRKKADSLSPADLQKVRTKSERGKAEQQHWEEKKRDNYLLTLQPQIDEWWQAISSLQWKSERKKDEAMAVLFDLLIRNRYFDEVVQSIYGRVSEKNKRYLRRARQELIQNVASVHSDLARLLESKAESRFREDDDALRELARQQRPELTAEEPTIKPVRSKLTAREMREGYDRLRQLNPAWRLAYRIKERWRNLRNRLRQSVGLTIDESTGGSDKELDLLEGTLNSDQSYRAHYGQQTGEHPDLAGFYRIDEQLEDNFNRNREWLQQHGKDSRPGGWRIYMNSEGQVKFL